MLEPLTRGGITKLKNIQFCNFLKMPIPLTIEDFEIDQLRAKPFVSKNSGVFTYFVIPFEYDGGDPLIKIEGNFRVFKHVNNGRANYTLAISINDENEEFFSELGHRKPHWHLRIRVTPRNLNPLSHQTLS